MATQTVLRLRSARTSLHCAQDASVPSISPYPHLAVSKVRFVSATASVRCTVDCSPAAISRSVTVPFASSSAPIIRTTFAPDFPAAFIWPLHAPVQRIEIRRQIGVPAFLAERESIAARFGAGSHNINVPRPAGPPGPRRNPPSPASSARCPYRSRCQAWVDRPALPRGRCTGHRRRCCSARRAHRGPPRKRCACSSRAREPIADRPHTRCRGGRGWLFTASKCAAFFRCQVLLDARRPGDDLAVVRRLAVQDAQWVRGPDGFGSLPSGPPLVV